MTFDETENDFDVELRHLLQQVDIPDELQSSLRSIPDCEIMEIPRPARESRLRSTWSVIASIAALLLVGIAIGSWLSSDKVSNRIVDKAQEPSKKRLLNPKDASESEGSKNSNNTQMIVHQPSLPAPKNSDQRPATTPDSELELAEQEIAFAKIALLEQQLLELQENSSEYSMELDPLEIESLVFAISGQAIESFGGSKEQSKIKLERVIDRYPDTQGAAFALKYVSQLNQN